MSDKLEKVFIKHSGPEAHSLIQHRTMSFDQFRAALEEIVPSEEEIRNKAVDCAFDESQFQYGAKWMRLKILGKI